MDVCPCLFFFNLFPLICMITNMLQTKWIRSEYFYYTIFITAHELRFLHQSILSPTPDSTVFLSSSIQFTSVLACILIGTSWYYDIDFFKCTGHPTIQYFHDLAEILYELSVALVNVTIFDRLMNILYRHYTIEVKCKCWPEHILHEWKQSETGATWDERTTA